MSIPDDLKPTLRQRQTRRQKYAVTLQAIVGYPRLESVAQMFIREGTRLLEEDRYDLAATHDRRLNGSLSSAIEQEIESWNVLQSQWDAKSSSSRRKRIRESLDTIVRMLAVERTLIELGIPETPIEGGEAAGVTPLELLYREYSKTYGKPVERRDKNDSP